MVIFDALIETQTWNLKSSRGVFIRASIFPHNLIYYIPLWPGVMEYCLYVRILLLYDAA